MGGLITPEMIFNLKSTENMDIKKKRTPKRDESQMLPQPVEGESGLVQVDTTWGEIQPLQVRQDIRTVDEIEVYEFQEKGLPIIDARTTDFYDVSTIPEAKNIPYNEIIERMSELDRNQSTIFFCNGPQCPQSSSAIHNLLEAGYPPEKILYYRGGVHDWVTLGLPIKNNK